MDGSLRIAVDTGGTFSDVVIVDERGRLLTGKAPTTPTHAFDGILEAIEDAAAKSSRSAAEVLATAQTFVYGTTRATNAIVTGQTARTSFVTTRGFGDTLVVREGGKTKPFNLSTDPPRPYVPKRLTWEIDERIDAQGAVVRPLDERTAREAIEAMATAGVEAVAVSLLWSIANPAHEQRLGELLDEVLPGVPYTLAHRLNPALREYRRASSATIDASLKPLMQQHLLELETALRDSGFAGRLLVVTSFGGVLDAADVAKAPIYSVNSGPAMAPVAGRGHAPDEQYLVVCDMGGTTFDVSLVRGGLVEFTKETWLGGRFTGHMTGLASVDVRSIGAGGGSIAWIDTGGLLRVGPDSAGAVPGPACYGRGGTRATVTDAAVVVGFIDPARFLDGRLPLDAAAARAAIREDIARPLGLDVEQAAQAVLTVVNESMMNAIRDVTIARGVDPRKALVVAGGGAAGMSIAAIAGSLGCDRVLVPRTAAVLSATGGHFSDMITEFSATLFAHTASFDVPAVNATLEALDAQIDAFLDRLGIPDHRRAREFWVEAHYPYQAWELDVLLPVERFSGPDDVSRLVEAFGEAHERVFGVREQGQHVECLVWRGRAIAVLPTPSFSHDRPAGDAMPREVSPAVFDGRVQQVARYEGSTLPVDGSLEGPVIVEEAGTTIVVPAQWTLTVQSTGDYLLERRTA